MTEPVILSSLAKRPTLPLVRVVGSQVLTDDVQDETFSFSMLDSTPSLSPDRDILMMSTAGVRIQPMQSAWIINHPRRLVYKISRFVISNANTAGGADDWIVNDIKIGGVSQFGESGDLPGSVFASNAIEDFVRFSPVQTALDTVVVVVTYIGLNESGCTFHGALVGTVVGPAA